MEHLPKLYYKETYEVDFQTIDVPKDLTDLVFHLCGRQQTCDVKYLHMLSRFMFDNLRIGIWPDLNSIKGILGRTEQERLLRVIEDEIRKNRTILDPIWEGLWNIYDSG